MSITTIIINIFIIIITNNLQTDALVIGIVISFWIGIDNSRGSLIGLLSTWIQRVQTPEICHGNKLTRRNCAQGTQL